MGGGEGGGSIVGIADTRDTRGNYCSDVKEGRTGIGGMPIHTCTERRVGAGIRTELGSADVRISL